MFYYKKSFAACILGYFSREIVLMIFPDVYNLFETGKVEFNYFGKVASETFFSVKH